MTKPAANPRNLFLLGQTLSRLAPNLAPHVRRQHVCGSAKVIGFTEPAERSPDQAARRNPAVEALTPPEMRSPEASQGN